MAKYMACLVTLGYNRREWSDSH